MLLIAEIILTVFAWRNGWKWLALLPIGICMMIGFCVGFIIGSNGGNTSDISGVFILDIMAIIVLIIMVSKEKKVIPQEIKKEE